MNAHSNPLWLNIFFWKIIPSTTSSHHTTTTSPVLSLHTILGKLHLYIYKIKQSAFHYKTAYQTTTTQQTNLLKLLLWFFKNPSWAKPRFAPFFSWTKPGFTHINIAISKQWEHKFSFYEIRAKPRFVQSFIKHPNSKQQSSLHHRIPTYSELLNSSLKGSDVFLPY